MNMAVYGFGEKRGSSALHWCLHRASCLALLLFIACSGHPSSPPLANQASRRNPCVKHKVLD